MNYKKIYMIIINNAKKEALIGKRPISQRDKIKFTEYFEFHHILPKSLFPLWKKRESNIIALTAREHFFCHQLLYKIYNTNEMFYALNAFMTRPNSEYKIDSKTYERLRKIRKEVMSQRKGRKQTPESIQKGIQTKIKNGTFRIKLSEESKIKLSNSLKEYYKTHESNKKGVSPSEECRKKISKTLKEKYEKNEIIVWNKGKKCECLKKFKEKNGMYNKHFYTNGKDNVVAETCPEGYWLGITSTINEETEIKRREKITKSNTGRHWYNNGKVNKFCYECPPGFVKGFLCKRWIKN